jgi:hypothetical protein
MRFTPGLKAGILSLKKIGITLFGAYVAVFR